MSEIYLAGGCFWGLEEYIGAIRGVQSTQIGYANGSTKHPTYDEVCTENTGHVETVKVDYNSEKLPLDFLLNMFFDVIDPTTLNRQGADSGSQYRTGIYYTQTEDLDVIQEAIVKLQKRYDKPIVIEVKPLDNYMLAEEYHQKYLQKNPGGYCHIGAEKIEKASNAIINPTKFTLPPQESLKEKLSKTQFEVTQNSGTERPFENEYWDHYKQGIYVDVTTGEPLFTSNAKFESGCGWPSFSKPIDPFVVKEKTDDSHGMVRTEVRSRVGNAHMGHIFDDGPQESGGLRYCINSASLRFVPKEEMEQEGYGYLLRLVK